MATPTRPLLVDLVPGPDGWVEVRLPTLQVSSQDTRVRITVELDRELGLATITQTPSRPRRT